MGTFTSSEIFLKEHILSAGKSILIKADISKQRSISVMMRLFHRSSYAGTGIRDGWQVRLHHVLHGGVHLHGGALSHRPEEPGHRYVLFSRPHRQHHCALRHILR